jgi:hypothetical protein
MKKKSVFRKISFLLMLAVVANCGVFNIFSLPVKAADTEPLTNKTESYSTDESKHYVVDSDVTIDGNLTINCSNAGISGGGKLTINPGKTLTVRGDLVCYGAIYNYGNLYVSGKCELVGGIPMMRPGASFHNYSGAFASMGSLLGHEWHPDSQLEKRITHIENEGIVRCNNIDSYTSKYVNNSGDSAFFISNRTYYYTNNLDLNISITGTKSSVDDTKYISSVTVTPPSGFKITTDNPMNYSIDDEFWGTGAHWRDSIVINSSQSATSYWLKPTNYSVQNAVATTAAEQLPAITIKTTGADPAGAKYVIADSKAAEGNFYWTSVTLQPPTGYSEMKVTYDGGGREKSGSSVTFTEAAITGATVILKDADGQWTAQSYPVEDLYILDENPKPYYVTGEDDIREHGEDYPRYAKEAYINANSGHKVLLAADYNAQKAAGGTITGQDSIKVTSSIENPSIYVHNDYNDFWVGPISLDPIHVGMLIPETKYTLKGNKYKDKYYDSDVVLTPAEGFKVTTSKDKAATDKITFTKTTKNIKIYLVKEVMNDDHLPTGRVVYSDPISVGDIYIVREGEGKVNVNDLYYGGKVIPTVETKTNDVKKVTYKYKNASGGDYLKEAPSEVGKYVVEATFEMTDDYKELVVKDEFTISYLPTPTAPYSLEGKLGDNEIYTTDVKIIPADGYQISKTIKTGYVDSIELDKNGDIGYVYLKKKATGEMTDKIAIKEILIDKETPVITGIADKEVIYTDSKQVIVKDDNLFEVIVNGVKVAVSNGQAVIDLSADNGIMDYTIVMKDKAGNESTIFVTLITAWMQTGDVQEGVPLKLYPGYTYNFPEGSTWTIEGDPTVYCGGNKFVVTNNVEIKFKKN